MVDVSGVHAVCVRFCRCRFLGEDIQLLRYRWYPATSTKPQTVFTLDLLNTFHLLTLQGKLSAYDFYLSIERKTNNAGTLDIPVSSSSSALRLSPLTSLIVSI